MSAPFDKQKRPKVGIGVLVTSTDHTGCVLVGKRKGNVAGEGMFALPVGHLEFGETWEECAERELLEETGLVLTGIRFVTAVNAVEKDTDYHYITLFMAGQVDLAQRREPVNLEPEKCDGWEWTPWNSLPDGSQLFCPLRIFRKMGVNPFDGD
ncbi:nucleotide triphosphate diphosphatase NUDT15-like isoform X2 [Mya arenaria]|uniref:nucleotide triphosphate diphosphatase NUDT15-like isoform X2 n=1 Tax=Mya arenaria TaxID=6604 RepID=UPI0022DF50EF|nr:nucleotide triphosphate diphosphatase NUDT15-like isoform X2 [Mya arenaria]